MTITPFILENRERLEPGLKAINDTWQNLVEVLEWITVARTLPAKKDKQWSQVIIWGETDGLLGLENVKKLLVWNNQATLIISGGVYGREKIIGDVGSIDLYKGLEKELLKLGWSAEEIKRRVLIDSLSLHTGHQSIILSHVLKALNSEDVFVVVPLYHMPRFLLMLCDALKKIEIKPNIFPHAYGDWKSFHPAKAFHNNPELKFRYEELFALPPQPSLNEGKFDCGEADKIIERVQKENCLTFKEFISWININPSTP